MREVKIRLTVTETGTGKSMVQDIWLYVSEFLSGFPGIGLAYGSFRWRYRSTALDCGPCCTGEASWVATDK